MSLTPFNFLDNVPHPVRQIAHYTLLSNLPAENKLGIIELALLDDGPREAFRKESENLENAIWKNFPTEPLRSVNEVISSRLYTEISKRDAAECKELLANYFSHSPRILMEPWYNQIKDEKTVAMGVFEAMKQRLIEYLPEMRLEAREQWCPEGCQVSEQPGPQVFEAEPQEESEAMECEENETMENVNADQNRNVIKMISAPVPKRSSHSNETCHLHLVLREQDEKRASASQDYEPSRQGDTVIPVDQMNYGMPEKVEPRQSSEHEDLEHWQKHASQTFEERAADLGTIMDNNIYLKSEQGRQHLEEQAGETMKGWSVPPSLSPYEDLAKSMAELGHVVGSLSPSQGRKVQKTFGRRVEILQSIGDQTSYEEVYSTVEQSNHSGQNSDNDDALNNPLVSPERHGPLSDDSLEDQALSPTEFHSLDSQADQSIQSQDKDQATEIEQDFETDSIPEEDIYNVLLLGETGVGKTTFINSSANYIKYGSMEEALREGPEILMDTTFTTSEGVKTVHITVPATTGDRGARNSTNEHTAETGTSRTQEPLIHKLLYVADGRRKMIRFIDTPGVNDTRGLDQDTVNFRKVLHLIQKLGKLHAICLLLKPNESRMTVGFQRSLDYFLTKLHSNALRNILFCFTNTRSTFYLPGDSFALLESYFKDLKKSNGVEVILNNSNVFCFENDCFRYMCLLLDNQGRENKNHRQIAASWQHNVPQVRKLLDRIQNMTPHVTEDTTKMESVDELLSELARPLMEVMQNLGKNKEQIARLMVKINKSTTNSTELKTIMSKQRTVLKKRFLPQPRNICTARRCSTLYVLADGSTGYQPKKPCHDPCFTPSKKNGKISDCEKFSKSGLCLECRCHIDYHQHILYKLYYDKEDVIDETVRQELAVCDSETRQQQIILDSLNRTLQQLTDESNFIKKTCAEFSAFLRYSSMKAGADPYHVYLSMLIRNEPLGTTPFYELEDILKEHTRKVGQIVREVKYGHQVALTYDQIEKKIGLLCGLKNAGELILGIAAQIMHRSEQNGVQRL